ncbi:hypothetical protein [Nocardia sp. NPDC057440]|uniref:hypothetical protein n=1 Tax=Nocardia sp. NPDC057440 TaxID=3346134 RepID=UPI003671F6F6
MKGSLAAELLQRLRQHLSNLADLEAGGLRGGLHGVSDGVTSVVRDAHGGDEHGAREVLAALGDRDQTSRGAAAVSRASSPAHGITDLSHMPPLGDLLDKAQTGKVDDLELTRAFKGLERQYGPYRVADVRAWSEEGWTDDAKRYLFMEAKIRDSDGAEVGKLLRNFERDSEGKLVAINEIMELEEHARGKGFSTVFSASVENYYRRSGVDRIELRAEDDGGYVWAKAGYDWDPDPHKLAKSVDYIQQRIDKVIADGRVPSDADVALLEGIKQRFRGPVIGFPSPQELALLAGDDPKLGDTVMRGSIWFGMKKL